MSFQENVKAFKSQNPAITIFLAGIFLKISGWSLGVLRPVRTSECVMFPVL